MSKFILTLEVDYDLGGETADTMKEQLRGLVDHAVSNGQLSGDTAATVESWQMRVDLVPHRDDVNSVPGIIAWSIALPEDAHVYIDDDGMRLKVVGDPEPYLELGGHSEDEGAPVMIPLTVSAFREHLESIGEAIDPEDAFREVCLANDGEEWCRLQDKQTDGEPRCKLELSDKPAFRQGLNDNADALVKDRQWVTFDNGNTYYSADDIKETIDEFENRSDTYDPTPELKEIISYWL